MDKSQKIIGISLVTISIITWIFSKDQPDMMHAMMTLNPVAVTIFTISWTVGMAAMMFPAIIPMVLLYNRFITSKTDNNNSNNNVLLNRKLIQDTDRFERKVDVQHHKYSYLLVFHRVIKTSGFVGTYLLVWSLTGVALLLFWSVLMNNLFVGYNTKDFAVISGILLLISGIYQFSPLKKMFRILRVSFGIFYEEMEGKQIERWIEDGIISWNVLSWMLLALFDNHDCTRLDESFMDGFVCSHHFYRKNLVKRNLDSKRRWNHIHTNRITYNNGGDISSNRRK